MIDPGWPIRKAQDFCLLSPLSCFNKGEMQKQSLEPLQSLCCHEATQPNEGSNTQRQTEQETLLETGNPVLAQLPPDPTCSRLLS